MFLVVAGPVIVMWHMIYVLLLPFDHDIIHLFMYIESVYALSNAYELSIP